MHLNYKGQKCLHFSDIIMIILSLDRTHLLILLFQLVRGIFNQEIDPKAKKGVMSESRD